MNLIGHNYIAFKLLGRMSSDIFVGSHIPDFVPFLPSSIFSFDEIHENHKDFLRFVQKNYPNATGLPLGMLCHSVEYGADEYNRDIDEWLLKDNEELAEKLSKMIVKASNITYKVARGPRLHNYLWCGVDLYLIKNNPGGIIDGLTDSLGNINYKKTAEILSQFYNKDVDGVELNLREHFKIIKRESLQTTEGFTKYWSKFLSTLDEKDNLDMVEGVGLLEFIYKTFENEWEGIIDLVERKVGLKMKHLLD